MARGGGRINGNRHLALVAALLLATIHSTVAQSADAASQAAALRQIGDALGATRGGFSSDAAANDPCDQTAFPGVTCDANGQVTSISLAGKQLSGGSLPDSPATWQALPGLRTLDASNAGLSGALPAAGLSAAPNLATVNLSGNDFSGGLGGVAPSSLESLNLAGNAKLCGDVPAAIAGKADVTGTGAGTACGGEAAVAADPAAEAAAPATAEPAAPAPAPTTTATTTPPTYCVCATNGLDSQGCKDEVYNNCDAAKTSTPSASCGDLQSGDAARIAAAVEKDCGAPVVAASSSASPSPSPASAGEVAEVAAPGSTQAPKPPAEIDNAPICAACAVRGFASAECDGALASLCATPGAAPKDVCDNLPSAAKDVEAAKNSARLLGDYLQQKCFRGGSGNGNGNACACFSSGVSTSDCAQARVQLCAKGDALCLPFQALSGAPAGTANNADALLAEAAAYGSSNCPVAAPERPGVQAALTFGGVGVSQYASGYSQGVANALATVGGVPSSDVRQVDVRPAAAASSAAAAGRRRFARRFLLQQQASSSSSAVQATYFLQSTEPEALAQRLQQSAQDGSLVTALGNNGVQGTPSLSLKSYLPAGSLGGGEGGSGANANKGGFPLWALAPIIIGALLLLGLLVGLCLCCRRRRAQQNRAKALPAGGKLVVGGAAAAGVGAAAGGVAAARAADNGKVATTTTAPTAYSTDPYADPYAPTTNVEATRSGSAALNAALGGGSAPAAPLAAAGVGAAGVGAAAAASGRRSGSGGGGGKDIQSVPLPAPARTPSASGAAPSASEWKTGGGAGGGASSQQRSAGGAGPTAAAVGAAGAAAVGAAGVGAATAGRSSAQQAERAKFWAQFQESWQQVRQNKEGTAAGKDADEPGTPSSGTQWTDQ
jgi:hypothetical protein